MALAGELLLRLEWRSNVIVRNVRHSVCRSVCEQDKLTNVVTVVDQTWQVWARDDPLEVIKFWC